MSGVQREYRIAGVVCPTRFRKVASLRDCPSSRKTEKTVPQALHVLRGLGGKRLERLTLTSGYHFLSCLSTGSGAQGRLSYRESRMSDTSEQRCEVRTANATAGIMCVPLVANAVAHENSNNLLKRVYRLASDQNTSDSRVAAAQNLWCVFSTARLSVLGLGLQILALLASSRDCYCYAYRSCEEERTALDKPLQWRTR